MIKYLEKNDNYLEIINKDNWIVDFYADWCGPCKMLGPVLEKIDFANVLKINVDEFSELASKFGIMSIPTLIFYKNGCEKGKIIGFHNLEEIKKTFEQIEN